ncbi:Yip1 family protein [Paraferrimonas sp. SM1919]|uniref:Yip1 family protein n=1 Tax=Paraferrimonas sp. SM1919 TaxID=2662263 RepID=UPI0013D51A00|nr:Yip1 family protein [Paraferrimonas sp. SM1919]
MEQQLRHPLKEIWFYPREAIKALQLSDYSGFIIPLAVLSGITQGFSNNFASEYFESLTSMLLVTLIVASIAGIIGIYVSAWLLSMTGKWLGGKASFNSLVELSAWASLIQVLMLPLLILLMILMGNGYVDSEYLMENPSGLVITLLLIFSLASIVVGIWSLVVMCVGISELQGFSILRALANILLFLVIFVAVVVALSEFFKMFSPY